MKIPAILICFLTLSGCTGTPHRADLEMLHLVLKGKATHKQRFLLFERTPYEALVQKQSYFVKWLAGDVDEIRSAGEKGSVKDSIAQLAGPGEENPRFYFLVRGIGANETVFRGDTGEAQAASLTVTPGDLLIVDPSPNHVLFGRVPDRPGGPGS